MFNDRSLVVTHTGLNLFNAQDFQGAHVEFSKVRVRWKRPELFVVHLSRDHLLRHSTSEANVLESLHTNFLCATGGFLQQQGGSVFLSSRASSLQAKGKILCEFVRLRQRSSNFALMPGVGLIPRLDCTNFLLCFANSGLVTHFETIKKHSS